MKVRVDETGEEIEIPDSAAGEFAARGGVSFPEGAAIPVKHDDGTVSSVPVQEYWAKQSLYRAASQTDIAAQAERDAKAQAEQLEAQKDAEFGEGIANTVRAGAEGVARGVTLGASDWIATQMGASPEGLRERAERNPVAAFVGEAAGTVAPMLLTGGAGALGTAARLTPAVAADAIGLAVGKKVAEKLGTGFTARLAAGSANLAAQGALAGVGGEISQRTMNGQPLLDDGSLSEYLMAAGTGALVGGAFGVAGGAAAEVAGAGLRLGGKALDAGKDLLGKAQDAMNAPLREAETALGAAKAADYDAGVRAAEQRMQALTMEDLSPEAVAHAKAVKAAEQVAPSTSVLSSAEGLRADAPLQAVRAKAMQEAEALGVSREAATSAWDRIEQGRVAFATLDTERDAATRRISEIGDELQRLEDSITETAGMQRRNDAMRKALASDPTAAPPESIVEALRAQQTKIRAELGAFVADDDSQIRSYAKKLDTFLASYEREAGALGGSLDDASSAFEILDQTNRLVGRVRDKIGDRSSMGIGTFSDRLADLYEDTRLLLKNPEIVGSRVAEISSTAKARWSDTFDVSGGYRRTLLSGDTGGARTVTGWDTVDRWDPKKVSGVLSRANSAEGQLELELVGRGLDTRAKLFDHFSKDLGLEGSISADVARHAELTQKLADEFVTFRSKIALADEYSRNVAPAMREVEATESKLAVARQRAQEKLDKARAKAQEAIDKEVAKAGEAKARTIEKAEAKLQATQDRLAGGLSGALLEGAMSLVGGAVGGAAGAIGMGALARHAAGGSLPILRQLGHAGLQASIRTGEVMSQLGKVAKVGARLQQATVAIGDVLRTAKPLSSAARMTALRQPRDTQAEYDRAVEQVTRLAATDARAAYLQTVMPPARERLQMRPDLDSTPTVHTLDQRKFLRHVEAATDPVSVVEAFAQGRGTREGAVALQVLYPRLHQRVVADVMAHAAALTKPPAMSAQRHLGALVGQPLHFTDTPEFVKFVQSAYSTPTPASQGAAPAPDRARQVNAKTPKTYATPGQRLEGGVGGI